MTVDYDIYIQQLGNKIEKLNETETKVLKLIVALAEDETGGEFTWASDVTYACQDKLNINKHQASGYISSLCKKEIISTFEVDSKTQQICSFDVDGYIDDINEYFKSLK